MRKGRGTDGGRMSSEVGWEVRRAHTLTLTASPMHQPPAPQYSTTEHTRDHSVGGRHPPMVMLPEQTELPASPG